MISRQRFQELDRTSFRNSDFDQQLTYTDPSKSAGNTCKSTTSHDREKASP
jgi:hypothetical protein